MIAEKGSDVAQEFLRGGRMKELVESFASCSKALAIWTSDKKGSQTNSKKIREVGWYVSLGLGRCGMGFLKLTIKCRSRELWSIKP